MPHVAPFENELPTNRIEALSDGVFAIVMTLLVIEIHVPSLPKEANTAEFLQMLGKMWPEFFHYALSFIILGVYWVGHHKQFHYIIGANRVLLWLNILFLMLISLIPFSTSLLGAYHNMHIPIIIYSGHLMLTASILYFKWCYATKEKRFVQKNICNEAVIKRGKTKIRTGIFIYLLAIGISFVHIPLSAFFLVLVPILYILPSQRNQKFMP